MVRPATVATRIAVPWNSGKRAANGRAVPFRAAHAKRLPATFRRRYAFPRIFLMKLIPCFLALVALVSSSTGETLKINGSTTVNLPVAEAAENLRAEKKMQIHVDTQGGSSGGISMLGDGSVQVG